VDNKIDFDSKPVRLQKLLAACGVASRRGAEKLILEGRVKVNGVTAGLGQSAVLYLDSITVDGVKITGKDKRIYLMLNKPCGYLTTKRDQRGRKTVMELVADVGMHIFPVGRLDKDSEGMLLFTNDGEFANVIMHPSFGKQKVYEVDVRGDVQNAVSLLKLPVKIDDHTVHACNVELKKVTMDGGTLLITIIEGRNRQIRKMCTVCGVPVKTLKRISIGTLELGDLQPGKWRYLTDDEVLLLG